MGPHYTLLLLLFCKPKTTLPYIFSSIPFFPKTSPFCFLIILSVTNRIIYHPRKQGEAKGILNISQIMFPMAQFSPFILLLSLSNLYISGVYSASTFTLINKCDYTVWPGMLSNAGISPLPTTGFVLEKGESREISAPDSWGGRLWARTHCSEDSTGKFSCLTGDCGSGKLECTGGATPPATLAEFTLNGHNNMDFFDVSLVDGYNLPLVVVPRGGSGINCTTTGCFEDLNGACPSELKVMSSGGDGAVACKSACEAFQQEEYCCSGAHGTPDTCKPSSYSEVFKKACPTAYSYAYDDKSSTFTCSSGADYVITFCPSPNASQKSSSGNGPVPPSGGGEGGGGGQKGNPDYSMVYDAAALDVSSASPTTCMHILRLHAVAGGAAVVAATWWLLSCHLI